MLVQVPLVGLCSSGVIGPNVPNNYCSMRSTQDDGAEGAVATGQAGADAGSGTGVGAEEDIQLRLHGVDRSELLSFITTLTMLAG